MHLIDTNDVTTWRRDVNVRFLVLVLLLFVSQLLLLLAHRLVRQLEVVDEHSHEQVEKDEVLDDDVQQQVEHDVAAARVSRNDVLVNLEPVVEREELEQGEEGGEESPEVRRVDVGVEATTDDGEHVHEERDEKHDGADGSDGLEDGHHDHLQVR